MSNILFATSEVYPLIKTGGLADVAASLPRALTKLGQNLRILLPAYASVMKAAAATELKKVNKLNVDGQEVILWKTRLPNTRVVVWLVDIPAFSAREGNPYCATDGNDWPDNAQRFYLFAKVARLIALNIAGLKWPVDLVHCNDWQTGLIPALLSQDSPRPATVFTIHNLSYRGLFSYQTFVELGLPYDWWHPERIEFYGQISFIKGGLVYADRITSVSPTYAQEIQTLQFGNGLDGLLRYRQTSLSGILNGIDTDEWNPATDPYLAQTYNRKTLNKKQKNKIALQESLGLTSDENTPLLGFIGRLVDQKGIALIIEILPRLLSSGVQVAILGAGMTHYESMLKKLAGEYGNQLSVTIGYNESLAHQIEAGVDMFLMPSAFEPCGLNQMYSLRYGTVPIVHAVGGLRDTITDFIVGQEHSANGFWFIEFTGEALLAAIERAIQCYQQKKIWQALQVNGMSLDLSWQRSARDYVTLYESI